MQHRLHVGDLVLDKASMVPLYLQLKQHIVHLISDGTWQPSAPVPSVRQLAADLQMATATVQRVYNELQREGLLIGRPGRGVFVTELASGLPARTEERSEILRALFARSVSHARSLGFGDAELLEAIGLVASGPDTTPSLPRIVFVGSSVASVRKYPSLLRDALGRLGMTVDGVLFADLERDEQLLEPFEPIRMIVALVGTYPRLHELAMRRNTPIYGLVVDLTESTQRALIHLPTDGPVALIGQQVYQASARALLRQYFVGDDRVRWADPNDLPRVRELVNASPIVIHTLAASEVVQKYALPSTLTIELEYLPNPASLARLVSLLGTTSTAAASARLGAVG